MVFRLLQRRTATEIAQELFGKANSSARLGECRDGESQGQLWELSLDALSRSTEEFLKLGRNEIDSNDRELLKHWKPKKS